MKSTLKTLLHALLLVAGIFYASPTACADDSVEKDVSSTGKDAPATEEETPALADATVESWRTDLLELAFSATSAFPLDPHIKNRSTAQANVVRTCLALDLPLRAERYCADIRNWRRGECYAELALHCARKGFASDAERFLEMAREISKDDADAGSQPWRRDRIRVKIARACLELGKAARAAEFEAGLVASESGKAGTLRAETLDAKDFEAFMASIDAVFEGGHFDLVRTALNTCVVLFDRFYGDDERRAVVEKRMRAAWKKLPLMLRIRLLLAMAEHALDHDDSEKALALLKDAKALMAVGKWLPEHDVPLRARMAQIRFRAGEEEPARADAAACLACYDENREKIVNMYRAGALRPLAEAGFAMGDRAAALKVYRKAVEEGVVNINSRPRAVDLAETCCSMALHGIEPDAGLRKRLREIHDALGEPW